MFYWHTFLEVDKFRFFQLTFSAFIERLRLRKEIHADVKKAVVACHNYDRAENSVIVEVILF